MLASIEGFIVDLPFESLKGLDLAGILVGVKASEHEGPGYQRLLMIL